MQEREYTVCVWLHHIATFVGLLSGIYHVVMLWENKDHGLVRTPGRVIGILFRIAGLLLFVWNQFKSAKKILDDFLTDDSRFRIMLQSIPEVCDTIHEERRMLWGFTGMSLLYQLGVPVVVGGSHRSTD